MPKKRSSTKIEARSIKTRKAKAKSGKSVSAKQRNGKIVTFYSYKGGTGRSMALANVAWVLAANGKQVLVIDWDFEAPGLHRYYRPFLPDPDLSTTPGLLDFFWEFQRAASTRALLSPDTPPADWFLPHSDLLEYAVGLDHDFGNGGGIDFIAAGRQFSGYGHLVTSFPWEAFYQKAGGGVLLEHVKARLRSEYDYVLIDSRTGLSDTSGICTVQIPDEVVMCFTYNRQSIMGVRAVGQSIMEQRRGPVGEPTSKLWPLPCRVDLSEKERLDTARKLAREQLGDQVWHLLREDKVAYWSQMEMLYFPYYAYEETLATIADTPGQGRNLLEAIERITAQITEGEVKSLPAIKETARLALLDGYGAKPQGSSDRRSPQVYVSYAYADISPEQVQKWLSKISDHLPNVKFFMDVMLPAGSPIMESLQLQLKQSQVVLCFVGDERGRSKPATVEFEAAKNLGRPIIPLFNEHVTWSLVPDSIKNYLGIRIDFNHVTLQSIKKVADGIRHHTQAPSLPAAPQDVDDIQKGQWGGKASSNGRALTAAVKELTPGWFEVTLTVKSANTKPLKGEVIFHLHQTYGPPRKLAVNKKGAAELKLPAYGASTVGVETDGGKTHLELDLSRLPRAPKLFLER